MVSLSNGVSVDGKSNKRPLENGYPYVLQPKYKRRKVSAVRHFPPGCGRNVTRVSLNPIGNVVSNGDKIVNGMEDVSVKTSEISGESQSLMGSPAQAEMDGSLDDLVGRVVALAGMVNGVTNHTLNANVNLLGIDLTEILENNSIGLSNGLHQSEIQAAVKESSEVGTIVKPLGIELPKGMEGDLEGLPVEVNQIEDQVLLKESNEVVVGGIELPEVMEGDSAGLSVELSQFEDQVLVKESSEVGTDVKQDGIDLPKGLVNESMGLENELLQSEGQGLVKEESEELKGLAFVKESCELDGFPMVKSEGAEDKKPVLEIDALADVVVQGGGAKSWLPPKFLIKDGNVGNESALCPKNKYHRRRVSATRHFPPFCGRNAPRPTDEDRLRITSRSKSSDVAAKVDVGSGPLRTTTRDVAEGEDVQEALKAGAEGGLVEELLKAGAAGGSVDEELRVGAEGGPVEEKLRTVTEEQDRDGGDGYSEKNELEGIVSVPRNKLKLVIRKSNKGVSGSEWKVEKQIEDHSLDRSHKKRPLGDNEVDRVIVHGLMAAPFCPWRQEKGSSTTSHGVMSGNIKRKDDFTARKIPKHVNTKGKLGKERSTTATKAAFDSAGTLVARKGEDSVDLYEEKIHQSPAGQRPNNIDVTLPPLGYDEVDRVIVHGLMAAPFCPWRQEKGSSTTAKGVMSGIKKKKDGFTAWQPKHVNKKGKSGKERSTTATKAAFDSAGTLVARNGEDSVVLYEEKIHQSPAGQRPNDIDVTLPPFGPNSLNHGDARNRVRETRRLFQAICRKLLHGEEAKSRQGQQAKSKRIDLQAAEVMKKKGKEVNTGKHFLGEVPGVEVGDEFQYRVELAIIGVHRLYQSGIDYMKQGADTIAVSIVASGAYADDLDNADVLIYSGQGGNIVGKNKNPEDQKLARGNLALKNSISARNPVRVIRGTKETKASDSLDTRAKIVMSYVYDGLYTVDNFWTDTGPHGKLVFMFELKRIPGQPELAWREVKKSKKYKMREGLCLEDITGGKESLPISAVNTIDDEKPPLFNYTTRMIYGDWYCPITPKGCECKGRCSDSQRCSCAVKNGGQIPYNYNGAIVEAKSLVYECGPSCKCPPSCYNRVTQQGIKLQLEIFKTEARGWGVRSLAFIPSGTFVCEYAGELLEDKEAEQRIDSDEYLFDIGQNYNDCSHMPDAQSGLVDEVEDGGYTIDAAHSGNVGRYINHSCSPNLYAQNVVYDNEDKRIPHVMFFAAENIPPLQELTYHYNYLVDQVRDSNGNIKMKSCYCGSADCTGRMY